MSRRRHADVMLASCSSLAFICVHHELIYEKKLKFCYWGCMPGSLWPYPFPIYPFPCCFPLYPLFPLPLPPFPLYVAEIC